MISTRFTLGIIALLAFIGLIVLVGKVYAVSFRLSPLGTKVAMASGVLTLASFILGITVGRSAQSMHHLIYTALNIIAGMGFYLFLGGIVLSVILLTTTLTNTTLPMIVPSLVLGMSILLGLTGLIQSRFITVTDYTVTLKDAPAPWDGKTAVLVSDTHFGLINHVGFSDKVVNKILRVRPDFVLHAGDFYDGPTIDTKPITASWSRLTAELPVFYAPGNHEGYGNYDAFVASVRDAGVTALEDKSVLYDGVQIAGIKYHGSNDKSRVKATLDSMSLDAAKPVILINHPPTFLAEAATDGVDLMVSGHTHNGQFWPNTYLVRIVYGAYYYGMNAFNDMTVVTTSGVGTFGPPFRLFNSPELVRITFRTQ